MILNPGENLCGFEVLSTEELPEINGRASVMIHAKSGARLLYLDNDDEDKVFSIAFRTPPADDTGVFHILEHSVLNGSARFDVKEPFVNLLKSSMQTFLNAMTFSDKTMYPVASTNEADLMNLVDVYMDAVLHPNIYRKPEIFWQEGWHYETAPAAQDITGEEDCPEERLTYNGVVFNEMKGVFSDANSVLYQGIQGALLPDTCYRFESGGAPTSIPELTYEQFLEEHSRHYRLDNSYITLYGDLNLERMLSFLDERYLSPFAEQQAQEDAAARAEGREPLMPRTIQFQQPLDAGYTAIPMATAPENACIGCGFAAGTFDEREKMLALDILIDAILGSNEAPLKRALLDADLSADASGFLVDGLLQPFAVVKLRSVKPNSAETFQKVIRETCTKLVQGELDHDLIEASLSHAEFHMRENDFGLYSSGIAFAMSSLASWLYDENDPLSYLRYESALANLREKLETTWWEELLREVFLDNPHRALVEVIPDQSTSNDAHEAARLAQIAQEMGPEGIQQVKDKLARLRAVQEAPDTEEGLASLPRLKRSDLGQMKDRPALTMLTDTPLPCLRHEAPSNGIAYVTRYFDLNRFSFEELPYIGLLSMMLGKLDTASHTASQLDTLINGKLGNLYCMATVFDVRGNENPDPKICVISSALEGNIAHLVDLEREVFTQTDFSDHARIKNILAQAKTRMEASYINGGHAAAMGRVASYYLPSALITEQMGGIEEYRLVKRLLTNFEEEADALSERMADLCERLFTDNAQVVTFTGSAECFEAFWEADPRFNRTSDETVRLEIPNPQPRNEAFIVPTDVTFSAIGYDRSAIDPEYSGTWTVASRIINYEYLWNEVRVKGGAYGAGFSSTRNGNTRFYSYRDPHIDQTVNAFINTGEWVEQFQPTEDDMDGFVVASVAGLDKPLKTRSLALNQDIWFFEGLSEEERRARREQMVQADAEQIRALAPTLAKGCENPCMCVFGNRETIEASSLEFEVIDLLNE